MRGDKEILKELRRENEKVAVSTERLLLTLVELLLDIRELLLRESK